MPLRRRQYPSIARSDRPIVFGKTGNQVQVLYFVTEKRLGPVAVTGIQDTKGSNNTLSSCIAGHMSIKTALHILGETL